MVEEEEKESYTDCGCHDSKPLLPATDHNVVSN